MPDSLYCFAVRACFAQVQEFDRMHSTAHGLAIGSLKIPRGNPGPGQTVLHHDDSPALLQHVDSPASSVQGQSWPYACNPETLSGTSQRLIAEVTFTFWCCVLAETVIYAAGTEAVPQGSCYGDFIACIRQCD